MIENINDRYTAWLAERPLLGKTVLVTRSPQQAYDLIASIEHYGGTTVVFPTIRISEPDSWEGCDRSIRCIREYDGIVFTSTNGVDFFLSHLTTLGESPGSLHGKFICAAGEATRRSIERHGLTVALIPERHTAADLARAIPDERIRGKRFLLPRGNLGNDTLAENLRSRGGTVDTIAVYRTDKPGEQDARRIYDYIVNGMIDVLTFTSPSTFNNFIDLFSPGELKIIREETRVAVIGPVTAEAVASAGWEVHIVAAESTMDGLAASIAEYYLRAEGINGTPSS